MKFTHLRIATRLHLAFGLIIALMVVLSAVGITRLKSLDRITSHIADVEWAKVEAALTVSALTRANAQGANELFLAADAAHVDRILAQMAANRAKVADYLRTLDRLVASKAGLDLLAHIKDEREAYVASLDKVTQAITSGRRDDATRTMLGETLPRQDRLLERYQALVDLQRDIARTQLELGREAVASGTTALLGLAAVAVLAAAVLSYFITTSITVPLGRAVAVARDVAAGDLTGSVEAGGRDETGQLLTALKDMNGSLLRIIHKTRQGVDAIATASSQIAAGNLDLSARTEQQATALEQTASSMEELMATVKRNADSALEASRMASQASAIATQGHDAVSGVVATMGDIRTVAGQIADIIAIMDGIAFQTNILALNAAVEAARAGEQGRGFAVVAGEVRGLAQRSASAAKDVKSLIESSLARVEAGTVQVTGAGRTMAEIVTSVQHVTSIVNDIAEASREQAAGIDQMHRAVADIDQVTQQNAALVEEAAAAASALDEQAAALADTIGHFRLKEEHGARAAVATRPALPAQGRRTAVAAPADAQAWQAL
ncbi:methyl-accepting chemotaxis protein [Massilia pinisoli]|uniref:Methyl-accepting chemotaxis protein n=1 Tax=Massilia pinisoli TaxID=1772194 RepID=A0ABT1ZPK0_9BURK|nr:methyl-accepting chemotaxis protein [Massilia pinisoli]MCS0581838.1 methyl-accepting chemotaxis protein [Massilia pinisoli]